jgi:hypothetical protein
MLTFNLILIVHFIAFLSYLLKLVVDLAKPNPNKDKKGLVLGIIILLTGLSLAGIKYPHLNYYKLVPKMGIFVAIATIQAIYSKKPIPVRIQYVLLSLTILASLIAVVKV